MKRVKKGIREIMPETPKRLVPAKETIRELYLKSGNECAFDGCSEQLIDRKGVFVGELCHIEAALPGGERFNPAQTNEERCSFDNLLLLCRKHHKVTNDVVVYTVEHLKRMKAEHEDKFTDIVLRIQNSLTDFTGTRTASLPRSLKRFYEVNGWPTPGDEELGTVVADMKRLAKKLKPVPARALDLLAILLERGSVHSFGTGESVRALFHDIVEACETDDQTVIKFVQILEHHGIVRVDHDEYEGVTEIVVRGILDWPFWEPLKNFCNKTKIPLREIVAKGRFDLLD